MRAYSEYDGRGECEGDWRSASCDEILEFINKFHCYLRRERRYYFVSCKLTQPNTVTCPIRRRGDLHNCRQAFDR